MIKKLIFTFFFFLSLSAFAAVGHLSIDLKRKTAAMFSMDPDATAIAETLVGLPHGVSNDKGIVVDIVDVSFAYGDDSAETLAFIGADKEGKKGIYFFDDNKDVVRKIADHNTQIPRGAAFFEDFSEVAYDADKNEVAFIGTGLLGQEGVYIFDGKKIIKAADQLTPIPGGTGKFIDFSDVNLFHDNIIFRGSGANNQTGLYLHSDVGIFKIMNTFDRIAGDKITDIHVAPDSFNQNQAVIRINFDTGFSKVYLVALRYVPY